ncbi:unnamed protein product [Gongylonema pulchrum]|uniref:Large ribosomal subunit protein uL18 n=1 Tax=Gongylonema pulchrum TaxID=637853 RepID=A0A183D9C7_9BILA|nr:unnamed protein product [Gongylonema pulchrum]
MELLKEQDEDAYKRHFSRFIAEGVGPEDIVELYKKAHEAIRANPLPAPKVDKLVSFCYFRTNTTLRARNSKSLLR